MYYQNLLEKNHKILILLIEIENHNYVMNATKLIEFPRRKKYIIEYLKFPLKWLKTGTDTTHPDMSLLCMTSFEMKTVVRVYAVEFDF